MEPTQKTTAKDFFLNLGAIIALYTTVYNLINLLFTVINKAYPQITNGYCYGCSQSISFPVATLIIFFPIFIFLSWLMSKDFVIHPEKKNLGIHKWLTYITLFIAGLAFAGDLVTILYYFIDGQELTTGFLLKALAVLVISGLLFYYYITDIRKMMTSHEKMSWRILAGVIILTSISWGFFVLGSPRTQRLIKYDEQKVNDLQNINNQVQSYFQMKGSLPLSLSDLSVVNGYVPVDQQTGKAYEYILIGQSAKTYELCATFNKESTTQKGGYLAYPTYGGDGFTYWNHPVGRYCFEQTIDKIMYPKGIQYLQ